MVLTVTDCFGVLTSQNQTVLAYLLKVYFYMLCDCKYSFGYLL